MRMRFKSAMLATVAAMGLGLSACDSGAENQAEDTAGAVREEADSSADAMEDQAEAVDDAGEQKADAMEDKADEADSTPG